MCCFVLFCSSYADIVRSIGPTLGAKLLFYNFHDNFNLPSLYESETRMFIQ